MNALVDLYDRAARALDHLGPVILPSAARLVFAGVLLMYFWASALTKIDGFGLSVGAYAQIFPQKADSVLYDVTAFSLVERLVIWAGTLAEFVLPALIVLGLLTRLAALGMVGFVVVQSLTDIYGHHADASTIGTWFDRAADSLIMDQRAFWMLLLAVLILKGAGPLSVDAMLRRPHKG